MAIARQIIFSTTLIQDQVSLSGFYSYDQLMDGNPDGHYFSCAYYPSAKDGVISMRPTGFFLGTHNAETMYHTFLESEITDEGSTIVGTVIPTMIAPESRDEPLQMNRFISVEMGNINALSKGIVVQYSVDKESPHLLSPLWKDSYYVAGENRAFFPDAVGRWLHLKILDNREEGVRDAWGGFLINYYPLGTRTNLSASS